MANSVDIKVELRIVSQGQLPASLKLCRDRSDLALRAWGFALRARAPQDDGTRQLKILRHQLSGTNHDLDNERGLDCQH